MRTALLVVLCTAAVACTQSGTKLILDQGPVDASTLEFSAPTPDGPLADGVAVDQGQGQPDQGTTQPDQGTLQPDQGTVQPDQGTTQPDQGTAATSGAIVITEFMANPYAVSDTAGEWVEVYNPGTQAVDLKGWTLKDDGSNKHVIASAVVVPAKGYAVLGRKASGNGGVPVDYVYSNFTLTNTDDEIELRDASDKLVDRVAYVDKWFVFEGYSTALKSPSLDNSKPENWCFSGYTWTGSDGDGGSPGAASQCPPNMVPLGCTHGATTTVQFSSHLCASILGQWKKITIRNGHDSSPVVGEWARLYCTGYDYELEAEITVARHTTYGGITQQEYQDDGFKDQAEMLATLQTYYPGITLSSPATVFRWTTPRLCNWP